MIVTPKRFDSLSDITATDRQTTTLMVSQARWPHGNVSVSTSQPPTSSFTHSLTPSLPHSLHIFLTHSLTHSLAQLTHSFTHALTHSRAQREAHA